jgi:hypothetical protein
LRKGIKIKAYTIFLAWMMIFSHNIIPHNHPNDNITGCHDLIHGTNPAEDDCNGPLKFKSQPDDINVCHISNFLYHQFSEDSFLHHVYVTSGCSTIHLAGSYLFKSEEPFIRDVYNGSVSFRAPPAA